MGVAFLTGQDGTPDDDAMGTLTAVRATLICAVAAGRRVRAAAVRAQASANDVGAALAAAASEAAARSARTVVFAVRTALLAHDIAHLLLSMTEPEVLRQA